MRIVADGFFRSKKGFTVVQNEITRDRGISLKAKGLYLVIQANITMPDKKWRKEDFQAMTCEGKKAFDSAWNELKEAGYLRVHMYSKGTTWTVEYELLDEPSDGAHTFYYNSQGELTRTNIERAATRAEKKAAESLENTENSKGKEENLRIPPFGSNGNGSNGKGTNGNGYNGDGSNGEGIDGNGGNIINNSLTNPLNNNLIINTSIQSYQSREQEKTEKQDKMDAMMDDTKSYMDIIKTNIEYDELMQWFDPEVRQRFDELYQIICDVVCVPRVSVRVNGEDYPYELVKSQFLKLNKEHVEYVAQCMNTNLGKVSNIRAYLITALYNAPSTYSNHVAQDYRTEMHEEYVSEYDIENKRKLEYMKQLKEEDPQKYREFIMQDIEKKRKEGVWQYD